MHYYIYFKLIAHAIFSLILIILIEKEDQNKIENAFEEYHRHTCIRFVPRKKEILYLNILSNKTGYYNRARLQYVLSYNAKFK